MCQASGVRATDQEARGPLVQTVDDPGALGVADPRRRQLGQVGEPGEQAVDQRPPAVAGAVVDHQAGRLVHHHDVPVLVDHGELDRGVRHQMGLDGWGQRDAQSLPGRHGPAARAHDLPVETDPTVVHQGAHRAARQAAQHRHHPIHPLPGEGLGHKDVDRRRPRRRRAHAATSRRNSNQAATIPPTTIDASATLNVGQKCRATKSTTAP